MMNELMYILLSPLLTEMLRGQVNILSAAIVPSIQKKKTSLLWKSSDTAYRTSSPYHSEAAAIKINLKKNRKTGPQAKRNTRRMINRLNCETKTSSRSWRRCW